MKKNVTKTISLLAVLALFISLLAACNSGNSGDRVLSGDVLNEGAGDGSYTGVEIILKSDGSIEYKNYTRAEGSQKKEYTDGQWSGTWTENSNGSVTITFDQSAADGYDWEYDTGTFGVFSMKTYLPETKLTAAKSGGKVSLDLTVRTEGAGVTTDMVYLLTEQ